MYPFVVLKPQDTEPSLEPHFMQSTNTMQLYTIVGLANFLVPEPPTNFHLRLGECPFHD